MDKCSVARTVHRMRFLNINDVLVTSGNALFVLAAVSGGVLLAMLASVPALRCERVLATRRSLGLFQRVVCGLLWALCAAVSVGSWFGLTYLSQIRLF